MEKEFSKQNPERIAEGTSESILRNAFLELLDELLEELLKELLQELSEDFLKELSMKSSFKLK